MDTNTNTDQNTTPVERVATEQAGEAKTEDTNTQIPTVEQNPVMAALSYIGPLVLIPFLTSRDNAFVLFHIKQGLVLFLAFLLVHVASKFLWFFFPIFWLLNFALFILSIVGIINSLQKKEKELPVIGKFASHIKI